MALLAGLRVLLWKNYLLKRRRPWSTLFETLVPLVLFLLIVWVRSHVNGVHQQAKYGQALPLINAGPVSFVQSLSCGHNFIDLEHPRETPLTQVASIINESGIDSGQFVRSLSNLSVDATRTVQLLARTAGPGALRGDGIESLWAVNYLLFHTNRLASLFAGNDDVPPLDDTNGAPTASVYDTPQQGDGQVRLDIVDVAEQQPQVYSPNIRLVSQDWSYMYEYNPSIPFDMHTTPVATGVSSQAGPSDVTPYLQVDLGAEHEVQSIDLWLAHSGHADSCTGLPLAPNLLQAEDTTVLFSDTPISTNATSLNAALEHATASFNFSSQPFELIGFGNVTLPVLVLQQPASKAVGWLLDVWEGSPMAGTLRALRSDARFAAPPSSTMTMSSDSLILPALSERIIGAKARATFLAPQTGFYRFFLSSNGEAELSLWQDGSDGQPTAIIDSHQGYYSQSYSGVPPRESVPVFLEAGAGYRMEVLVSGSVAGCQHMSVAVQLPDGGALSPVPTVLAQHPTAQRARFVLPTPVKASSVRLQLNHGMYLGVPKLSVNARPTARDRRVFSNKQLSTSVCALADGADLFGSVSPPPPSPAQDNATCARGLHFDFLSLLTMSPAQRTETIVTQVVGDCYFANHFVRQMLDTLPVLQPLAQGLRTDIVNAVVAALADAASGDETPTLPVLEQSLADAVANAAGVATEDPLVSAVVRAVTGKGADTGAAPRLAPPRQLVAGSLMPALRQQLGLLNAAIQDRVTDIATLLQVYSIPEIQNLLDGSTDPFTLLCGEKPQETTPTPEGTTTSPGGPDGPGEPDENTPSHGVQRLIGLLNGGNVHVYYSPAVGEVEELVDHIREPFDQFAAALAAAQCFVNEEEDSFVEYFRPEGLLNLFQGKPDEDAMIKASVGQENFFSVLGGIAFRNVNDDGTLPDSLEYAIRMEEHKTPDTRREKRRNYKFGHGTYWRYYYLGFMFLQDSVDRAFLKLSAEKKGTTTSSTPLYLNSFPSPDYEEDPFTVGIAFVFPMFVVLAWIYTVSMTVKSVVYEKEFGLKESMKMMGLPGWVHWAGWFITTLVQLTVSVTLLTIITMGGNTLPNSDPVVVWLVLEIYAISSIVLSFLMSCFFSKAKLAAACAGIVYFLLYLPYIYVSIQFEQLGYSSKMASMLSSTTALGLATQYISDFEYSGQGLTWSTLRQGQTACDDISVSVCLGMMIMDTFLYALLTWYIEAVFPGEFGVPRPWFFLFQKSYWLGEAGSRKVTSASSHSHYQDDDDDDAMLLLEDGSHSTASSGNGGAMIEITDLQKVYENPCTDVGLLSRCLPEPVHALKGVSLSAPAGAITVLLGHNGAGKTTLMSILCGLFPPTSGSVRVDGMDVTQDTALIRKSLGFCPQHNVLFDDLSCLEHLMFTARVKGLSWPTARQEAEKFLRDVNLWKARDTLSSNLSGGMKRKLSLCMAFIGGSKVVILDEPSAGLDPGARHDCWDLLLRFRKDRAVLVSTHYMDEADVLGDHVGIISGGKLRAYGSTIDLKQKHGVGYSLTVTAKRPADADGVTDGAEASYVAMNTFYSSAAKQLLPTVTGSVPGSSLAEIKGCDITYHLPSNQLAAFPALLSKLETEQEQLKIDEFGIAAPSLEDAFIRVTEASEREDGLDDDDEEDDEDHVQDDLAQSGGEHGTRFATIRMDESGDADGERFSRRARLPWLHRFKALFIKRFHNARRDRKALVSQVVLPAVFVWIALMVATAFPPGADRPPLTMSASEMSATCDGGTSNNVVPLYDTLNTTLSRRMMAAATRMAETIDLAKDPEFLHPRGTCRGCSDPKNVSSYLLNTWGELDGTRYGAVCTQPSPSALVSFSASSGQTLSGPLIRMFFDPRWMHTAPMFLNFGNNALLQADTDNPKASIKTINHPLPLTFEQKSEAYLRSGTDLTVAIMIIVAMSFVPASFVVYLVHERASKAKHLQFVSGATASTYWVATIAWDYLNYMIPAILCMFIFFGYDLPAYTGRNFSATCLLLIMFGWSVTPMMYPASFVFRVPATAYVTLICANLFVGLTGTLATFILDIFAADDPSLASANRLLHRVLLFFPQYCLGRGIIDMARNEYEAEYAELVEGRDDVFISPLTWNICGKNLVWMAVEGVAFFLLNISVEYIKTWQIKRGNAAAKAARVRARPEDEDEDVVAERRRVSTMVSARQAESAGFDDIMVVDGLRKVYKPMSKKKKKVAVDDISFAVGPGDVFGLLGVNGAGKTSTFKMLTGDHSVSGGQAWVANHSILTAMQKVHQCVGYTPQFDALNGLMTARETLYMYGRLRGIAEADLPALASWAIRNLHLTRWADRPSRTYSGGNKRKLSVAIALMPGSRLLMMDEPSAGVDVRARRFLWRVIRSAVHHGRSVLLTSHAMDECEALCSRIAIMVNGRFYCMGSPQHLKNKFGRGYNLIVKLKPGNAAGFDAQPIKEFVASSFAESELLEEHQGYLAFLLPAEGMPPLSQVFAVLHERRDELGLEDYLLSQATLHSVFKTFSLLQDSDRSGAADEGGLEDDDEASDDACDEASGLPGKEDSGHSSPGSESDDDTMIGFDMGDGIPLGDFTGSSTA
eukprot:m.206008 g.206008  ORF g.206008 m.206008 type:complete len:2576 (+) comp18495_c0_seq1:570-8297(+)